VFALVLLVAAGSLIKNFRALMDVYQAYEPTRVLKVRIALPEKRFPDNPRMTAYYNRLLAGIRALPGVEAAGVGANIPASNVENRRTSYVVDGNPVPQPAETSASDTMIVSPGFLESLHVAIVAGRPISAQDGPESPRVAMVSQSFARREWPDGSAMGHRLRIVKAGAPETSMTIVGVVADVQQNWWDQKGRPVIYYPYSQAPQRGMVLLARTVGDPLRLAGAVRSVASSVALDVPLNTIQTMNGEVVDAMAPIQILGSLIALFGGLALTLAAVGIYGLLSFGVARRTREFGMRVALGATPRDLCKLVFAQALKLTGIGLAIGVPLAIYLSRAVGRVLFGAGDVSAAIIAAFSAVILLSAVAAGLVPALRAMRVDPLQALHLE
jgi:putative ABC transport system permease protein